MTEREQKKDRQENERACEREEEEKVSFSGQREGLGPPHTVQLCL